MQGRNRWAATIAALAFLAVGTAVVLVGTAMRDPAGRGERHDRGVAAAGAAGAAGSGGAAGAGAAGAGAGPAGAAGSAPGDTGVARGGPTPRGQTPVAALTFPRFQNAFNADADDTRLLILLSPT